MCEWSKDAMCNSVCASFASIYLFEWFDLYCLNVYCYADYGNTSLTCYIVHTLS